MVICGDLASTSAAADDDDGDDVGSALSCNACLVLSYVLWRITQNAAGLSIHQNGERVYIPLLMVMFPAGLSEDALPPPPPPPPAFLAELRAVMAARVETGDPPPGAEQSCVSGGHSASLTFLHHWTIKGRPVRERAQFVFVFSPVIESFLLFFFFTVDILAYDVSSMH